MRHLPTLTAAVLALALGGCVSFGAGGETPAFLMTLTSSESVAAGEDAQGDPKAGIAVAGIRAPQRLDVLRVPVQVDASSVAYLQDAQWVEKPAVLFERLLADTLRAKTGRLVIEGPDAEFTAKTRLTGQLSEMGYDAGDGIGSGSVIVRYDAVLVMPDGTYKTRRFEERVSGVLPEAASVAPVLNDATNAIAAQVADWVGAS